MRRLHQPATCEKDKEKEKKECLDLVHLNIQHPFDFANRKEGKKERKKKGPTLR